MIGLWFMLGGSVMFALAIAVGMNTSTGGTRSDHDDGSGFIAGLGTLVFAVGAVLLIVEIFT